MATDPQLLCPSLNEFKEINVKLESHVWDVRACFSFFKLTL